MSLPWLLTTHPTLAYNAIAFPLAYVGLTPTPSLASITLLLSTILLQTTHIFNQPALSATGSVFLLVANLSIASTLGTLSASTTALTNTAQSLVDSIIRCAATAIIALIPIAIRASLLRQRFTSNWLRVTLFPLIWAASWSVVSSMSPTGRVGTWTPLVGDEGYRWLRPFFGIGGIDFVAAGWASVAAEYVGGWIQGSAEVLDDYEEQPTTGRNGLTSRVPGDLWLQRSHSNQLPECGPRSSSSLSAPTIFAMLLLILAIPSYHVSPIPLPAHSDFTTPISVSCVLPAPPKPNSPKSPLELYIVETKAMASRARIHVWPEGAVAFDTIAARKAAMKEIQDVAQNIKVWIGASFDKPEPRTEGRHNQLRRNGMALIAPDGELFEYFKRQLVPYVESYRFGPSVEELPLSSISFPAPPTTPKSEKESYPRDLPVTASICLDFSQPLPKLPGRPALILGPASTWHPSIGLAMASLASARAEEVGAAILWCDGGSGAVNGVYGAGRGIGLNIEQVGNGGSWLASFGVPYSNGEQPRKTFYAHFGDWGTFLVLTAFVGGGWLLASQVAPYGTSSPHPMDDLTGVALATASLMGGRVGRMLSFPVSFFRKGGSGERAPLLAPQTGNLIDA